MFIQKLVHLFLAIFSFGIMCATPITGTYLEYAGPQWIRDGDKVGLLFTAIILMIGCFCLMILSIDNFNNLNRRGK